MYTCTVKNVRFQFRSVKEVLAKASEGKSGGHHGESGG